MAGINKDPLDRGFLTGKFSAESTFPDDDVGSGANFKEERLAWQLKVMETMCEVLTSRGRTMTQGALATIWALDERIIPIPSFKNVQQAIENAGR